MNAQLMDGWMDELVDEWMDEYTVHRWINLVLGVGECECVRAELLSLGFMRCLV